MALATLALASGCEKKDAKGPLVPYTGPLMETTNVLTLVSDSAKLKFQLTAPLEQRFENGDAVYPKGVKVTVYSSDGTRKVVNTITARHGKIDKAKNLYTLRGDVQVKNVPQEQRMNTEELFYDNTKGIIFTDSAMAVKVTTPNEYLTGFGLRANKEFSRYSIIKPTGVFALDPGAAL